ncbi:MAG TPA: plastocyanin/azurin family copper-binding protein [Frankiaceae bacterium]|jgi:plastocyanin|nr:plastocyanin/azurin family copper-binding protein [Frankiaceae bacterium]
MRRTVLALSTLSFLAIPVAAAAGGGCYADGPAQETPATRVVIEHACFTPFVATVEPGTKVTFVNASELDHNLTGPAIGYTEMPAGKTYEHTFGPPGTYVFACTIHSGMSGAVVVREAAAAPAAPAAPVASSGTASGRAGWAAATVVAVVAAGGLVLTRTPRG